MEGNTISCIIPCYNWQKFISETIESLINQNIRAQEIILLNDASTDNTLEILRRIGKQYSNIVKIIDFKENKGASYARNFGVDNAKGEYILFMDSDDIAETTLIEEYLKRLDEINDEYVLYYTAYIQIDEKGDQISPIVMGIQVEPDEILGYEFIRNYVSTSGTLVKRNHFIKAGRFNKDIKYAEDWDLWLRLAQMGGFAYINKPLIKIRRHRENMSSKVTLMLDAERSILEQYDIKYIKNAIFKRRLDSVENIVDYVSLLFRLDYWEEGFQELNNLIHTGYNSYSIYFYLGLYYLKNGNFKNALGYFHETINNKNAHGAALNNIGALLLLDGDKMNAKKYLDLAISYFPSYIDAKDNYKLLDKETIILEELRFTWRELRVILTNYSG